MSALSDDTTKSNRLWSSLYRLLIDCIGRLKACPTFLLLVLCCAGCGREEPAQSTTCLRFMAEAWMFGKYPVREAKERFEKRHKGVTVELIKAPAGWNNRLLVSMMSGRSHADAIFCPTEDTIAAWAARDLLEPWDDFIRDRLPDGRDTFLKVFLDGSNLGGVQYGLPISAEMIAISVNKRMAADAGLLDANGKIRFAKTWDEVFEYARRMTIDRDGDGKPEVIGMAINWSFGEGVLLSAIQAAEGQIADGNPMKLRLDSPVVRKLLTLTKAGADEGIVTLASMTDINQPRNDMKAGLVAMIVTVHSRYLESEQTLGKGNATLMPMPGPNLGGTISTTRSVVIPRNSRAIELAQQFMREELLAPYFSAYAMEKFGKLPCPRKVFDKLNVVEAQWLVEWAGKSSGPIMARDRIQMADAIRRNLQAYLSGSVDLDTMLNHLDDELSNIDMRDVREIFSKRKAK